MSSDKTVFDSGASRSEKALRFDLIPPTAIRREAKRYTLGADKHGAHNWRKGLSDEEFVQQAMNHIEEHWLKFKEECNASDDNLAAVKWGCSCLMEVERVNPGILEKVLYGRVKL